jgi:glycosyltransferase involved in cell wall biosynthesis
VTEHLTVIYLHQYFNTPNMPGSTRSFEMARRLVSKGHVVHMITSVRDGNSGRESGWRTTIEGGVIVHWLPVDYRNSMGFFRRLWAFVKFAIFASVKASTLKGDLVFATSTPLTIVIPGLIASTLRRVPLVFEVRDLWPDVPIAMGVLKNPIGKFLARRLEMTAYRRSAQVVALAPGMRDDIIAKGIDATKITVIPNGCDLGIFGCDLSELVRELRDVTTWLGSRKLVFYGGAVGRLNGVEYLVDVAAAMRRTDPEVRFLVIGEGAEWGLVECRARELGVLNANFFMKSSLPKDQLAVWLAASDMALALISAPRVLWKDAVQNKFFDALAAGKPVGCNFSGFQSQVAVEHGVGFIFPSNDAESAARVMRGLLQDEDWLNGVAVRARSLAAGQFNRDLLASRLEEVLTRAARGDKAA